MLMRTTLLWFVTGVLAATGLAQSTAGKSELKLALKSSDARLLVGFNWAKQQALAYAFDGDPVGSWYEAALPGREAFCMRDVAHQSMGGHALGLARYNLNMLRRFAENISESRDWCSFWEIDRYNRPAAVDYKNDAEFWYNLPANFDILDCCYRMYLWTGDMTYVTDPVFLNFYDRTVTDYVERWGLGLDRVMKRKRWMNVRGDFDPEKKFHFFRGDPSYEESREEYVLGNDLLATQYVAYLAYGHIQEVRGNEESARTFLEKARQVKALINTTWWNEAGQHFYAVLNQDHKLVGNAGHALLYRGAADDGPKARSVLNGLLESIKKRPSSEVEGQSHYAEILYRYAVPDVAYAQMMDLTRPNRDRREYPEVSYSVIGAMVTGTMGITVVPMPPKASEEGGFVDRVVRTLSGLGNIAWAELRNLPIRANEVAVRHEGGWKTVFTNQRGPALLWQATFAGSFDTLLVNGEPVKAQTEKELLGRVTSSVRVTVGAGDKVRVEIPK
jgi:hypothetical protein